MPYTRVKKPITAKNTLKKQPSAISSQLCSECGEPITHAGHPAIWRVTSASPKGGATDMCCECRNTYIKTANLVPPQTACGAEFSRKSLAEQEQEKKEQEEKEQKKSQKQEEQEHKDKDGNPLFRRGLRLGLPSIVVRSNPDTKRYMNINIKTQSEGKTRYGMHDTAIATLSSTDNATGTKYVGEYSLPLKTARGHGKSLTDKLVQLFFKDMKEQKEQKENGKGQGEGQGEGEEQQDQSKKQAAGAKRPAGGTYTGHSRIQNGKWQNQWRDRSYGYTHWETVKEGKKYVPPETKWK